MHSTRTPKIIDIRPKERQGRTEILVPDHFYPVITKLNRNPNEFAFLGERLKVKEAPKLRVLQVGLGNSVVGETLHILDILEKSGKPYELFCLDKMAVVLLHALEDQFSVKLWEYALEHSSQGISADEVSSVMQRHLLSLAPVSNLTQTHEPNGHGFGEFGMPLLYDSTVFRFDIPAPILGRVSYLTGDVAYDRIPKEYSGFDLIVCFRTLYQLADNAAIRMALENLVAYLNPKGLLAIDSARVHVYHVCNDQMEARLGLNKVYDSQTDSPVPLSEWPRVYELKSHD